MRKGQYIVLQESTAQFGWVGNIMVFQAQTQKLNFIPN